MQNLINRFKGREEEIEKYVSTFGEYKATIRYHCGLESLERWLQRRPEENDSVPATISQNQHLDGDWLLEAMLRKIQRLENLVAEKDKALAIKDKQIEAYQHHSEKSQESQILRIMEVVKA